MALETCWTLIRDAARGQETAQADFARRYQPVVRAYLAARWRGTLRLSELDDATQEVFVDCFRDGGLLGRADPASEGGFRAFLFGAVRRLPRLRLQLRDLAQPLRVRETSLHADLADLLLVVG